MDDDKKQQPENPELKYFAKPPAEEHPSISVPPPNPSYGNYGAPSAPPPRRSGRPLMTCLVVFAILSFLLLSGIILISLAGGSFLQHRSALVTGSGSVGLVSINEAIMDASEVMEVIEYYRKNDRIRAVLVRIDSPGGAVGSSQEIFEALKQLRRKGKIVVASMGNTAASGGYYVACGAQEIYANAGTLTGSIGVILGIPNIQNLTNKVGVQYEAVKSGKFKDIGSLFRPLNDEDRQLLQGVIGDVYEQFVEAIISQRREQLDEAASGIARTDPTVAAAIGVQPTGEKLLRTVADGRIFTGRKALAYGLVDKIGTGRDALNRIGQLIKVPEPELVEYKPRKSLRDLLKSSAKSAVESVSTPIKSVRLEYRMPF